MNHRDKSGTLMSFLTGARELFRSPQPQSVRTTNNAKITKVNQISTATLGNSKRIGASAQESPPAIQNSAVTAVEAFDGSNVDEDETRMDLKAGDEKLFSKTEKGPYEKPVDPAGM